MRHGKASGSAQAPGLPEKARAAAPRASPEGVLAVEVLSGDTPLPGARIQVYEREPADLLFFPAQWSSWSGGETGADGRRELPAPPGSYFITARAQGLAPASAALVHLPGAERTSVRLRLEAGTPLLGSIVVKGTGEPLSLAELILTPHGFAPDPRGRVEAPEEESLFTSSSEAGEFQFTGVAPGRYRAEARAPGYVSAVLPSVPVPFGGPITFELVPGGWLEGVVLRADAQPAAGVEVLASGRQQAVTAITDGEGHFSLLVPPGAHAVSARGGPEVGAVDSEVRISEGQRVQGLRIQLGAGAHLVGKVLRKDGAPVLGARVEVRPRGTSVASGLAGTTPSGAFSINPLAPGTYDVKVFIPGGARLEHGPLTLAEGGHASLTLTHEPTDSREGSGPRPSIRGTIISTNGAPVRRFLLDLVSRVPPQKPETHEFMGNQFELSGASLAQSQLLVLTADGQRAALTLDLRPGEDTRLQIPVYPGVPLTGRVVDASTREPVARAHVSLPLFGTVDTSGDGRFAFRDLPEGEHLLHVSRGSSLTTHPVKLLPGQGNDVGDLAIPAP